MSMIITSVLVQSYITVSRAWAIGDKLYKDVREAKLVKRLPAASATPKTA